MSWAPGDLVNDADLRDYEADILTTFNATSWQAKRTKALEDWLFPILKGRGFDVYRLRTRYEVDGALAYTSSVYTDRASVVTDTTEDDLNLATLFATPSTDAFYLGSTQPFRGIYVRLQDTVSSAAGVMTVKYWNGNWEPLTVADETRKTSSKTLSGSGAVSWQVPSDWLTRVVNSGATRLYWVKVTVSAVPTAAVCGQVAVIRNSALRAPATFRTLQLIMTEAPSAQEGPWREKAAFYQQEADLALQRALPLLGAEFDTDGSDQVSPTEGDQTAEETGGGPWALERA